MNSSCTESFAVKIYCFLVKCIVHSLNNVKLGFSVRGLRCNSHYYISKLLRALWLVNLAGRTLLHGPLKLKLFLMPNYCVIYHRIFFTYIASKSSKLSFTLNCVLKRANDLKKKPLKPLLMNENCSRTLQTHNRDNKYLTNLVFSVGTVSYGSLFFPCDLRPARFALGP